MSDKIKLTAAQERFIRVLAEGGTIVWSPDKQAAYLFNSGFHVGFTKGVTIDVLKRIGLVTGSHKMFIRENPFGITAAGRQYARERGWCE